MSNIHDFKSILDSPDRTFGSMLEVKVGAANKMSYLNRLGNKKILLSLRSISKAYPDIGLNIGHIEEEACKSFEFNENINYNYFNDVLRVIDAEHNIKFLACTIARKVIEHMSWEEAVEICYAKYKLDVREFNRTIQKLIRLSSQDEALKYRRITYTKFVLDMPLLDEKQKEIEKAILEF